jgi:hypothetical protein
MSGPSPRTTRKGARARPILMAPLLRLAGQRPAPPPPPRWLRGRFAPSRWRPADRPGRCVHAGRRDAPIDTLLAARIDRSISRARRIGRACVRAWVGWCPVRRWRVAASTCGHMHGTPLPSNKPERQLRRMHPSLLYRPILPLCVCCVHEGACACYEMSLALPAYRL